MPYLASSLQIRACHTCQVFRRGRFGGAHIASDVLSTPWSLAERVGFEPTCRLPDKTLSRRPRYDHFGTSPFCQTRAKRPLIIPTRGERPWVSAAVAERTLASAHGTVPPTHPTQSQTGD